MAVDRLYARPDIWNDLINGFANLVMNRRPVYRGEHLVEVDEAILSVHESKTDRGGRLQGLKGAQCFGGAALGFAQDLYLLDVTAEIVSDRRCANQPAVGNDNGRYRDRHRNLRSIFP